jgi:glycosyltransferase involved in cell wall biosynthesis
MKNKRTICLNMIVKNEAPVIRRSLGSVKNIIDYWVIVDTGSTDGTQEIIREFMRGVPGEIHERPWVNFETNRNEALALARHKTDYILFIDADEEFTYSDDFALPDLEKDYYLVQHRFNDFDFQRIYLINQHPDWIWKGVIHEAVWNPRLKFLDGGLLEGIINIYHDQDGHRAQDPNKCMNDAAILKKALQDDGDNPRYVFYLAQSYFGACDYLAALKIYEKRVSLDGCEEEKFWSYYRIAEIQQFHLNLGWETYIPSYLAAYRFRPSRIEPLYYIACHYFKEMNYSINYFLLKIALATPPSSDKIFIERWMFEWGIPFMLLQSAYNIGRYRESVEIAEKLLSQNFLPRERRETLEEIFPQMKEKVLAL